METVKEQLNSVKIIFNADFLTIKNVIVDYSSPIVK